MVIKLIIFMYFLTTINFINAEEIKDKNTEENKHFLNEKNYVSPSHWSYLPIFGDEARKKGYEIEPPFVISPIYVNQKQYINPIEGSSRYHNLKTKDVMNVELKKEYLISSLGDILGNIIYGIMESNSATSFSGGIDLNADGSPAIELQMGRTRERTEIKGIRAGFWLFPFMQVYGLYNRIDGYSTTPETSIIKIDTNNETINNILNNNAVGSLNNDNLRKLIDSIIGQAVDDIVGSGSYQGNRIIKVEDVVRMDLNADSFGAGITFAGGYKKVFSMIDLNYTYSKFDFSDDYTKTFVVSTRVGYNGKLFSKPFRLWTGLMGQYVSQKVTGRLTGLKFSGNTGNLMNNVILPESRFEIKQKLEKPINYLVGFRYTFTTYTALLFEGGYAGKDGRKSILLNFEVLF